MTPLAHYLLDCFSTPRCIVCGDAANFQFSTNKPPHPSIVLSIGCDHLAGIRLDFCDECLQQFQKEDGVGNTVDATRERTRCKYAYRRN